MSRPVTERDLRMPELVDEVRKGMHVNRVGWLAVADFGDPGDKEVLMYSPDMRNPTDMLIGKFIDGKWMSCGYEMVNVTHWAEKPSSPPTEQQSEE